jgi:hypothetical protein
MIGQALAATAGNFAVGLLIAVLIFTAASFVGGRLKAARLQDEALLDIERRGRERGRQLGPHPTRERRG